MPVGTRNTSPEQMAANLASYKAKVAAKIEARKAKATSSAEVDELSSLLSRVSMSSSVDDLDDLMKGLSMGGRRRTRRNKGKGKKRGGDDHADTIARCREEVKELEEAVDRLRRQRRGGTRKHKKHSRKTRRGGVELTTDEQKVVDLSIKRKALEKDPKATREEIAEVEKKLSDAIAVMKRYQMARGETPGYYNISKAYPLLRELHEP
jgi:hypothetical protein